MRFVVLLLGLLTLVVGCGAVVEPAASVEPVQVVTSVIVNDPIKITIPRLKVSDDVVPVGICKSVNKPTCEAIDDLQIPDVSQVGWFNGSPKPGDAGPALLAGHVNWHGVAGAFAKIGNLQPGDLIVVTDKSGVERSFVVYDVNQFKKAEYDANMPDLLANTNGPELRLTTCSGDLVGKSYLDNTVVSAYSIS